MGATSLPRLDAEMMRVQSALRRILDSEALTLEGPGQGGTIKARVGGETVGIIDTVSDEDGRSWVLTVPILVDDLA